jgi:AraC family transcriptional regulator of adaptative response/methylated-DNA-[protein]-cysteine methyltransferase
MSEALYYTTHDCVIGRLLMVATQRGVRYLTLLDPYEDVELHLAQFGTKPTMYELDGFFTRACAAIDRYLSQGEALELPFDLAGGTALQRMVWLALRKIPYGETISYTTLAERVGFPRAIRAVASACGANPVPLILPCHRVVAKDGTLGGFSLGGLDVKEKLLALEAGSAAQVQVA